MSDTPSRPVTPASGADKASDTNSGALEATAARPEPAPVPADPPTMSDGRDPAAPQLIGEFVVVGKLGEGGMGTVYLAEDVRLRRQVAIKTMKPELAAKPADRERFDREARAAAAVESDHIVPILHVDEAVDGTPFIVMPFLQGETLDARLKRDAVVPLDLVLKVAREVAEGLAAAHAKGLVHRDIKPANIWLEGDPTADDLARQVRRCKVLDFGLVRTAGVAEVQLTGPGAIMGTPAYMAPEQARGAELDVRADLFSLGATLYRAATGKLPFDGPTPMAVLLALANDAPPPLRALAPALPPALVDLIDRLMCKNPAGRPRSAAEVADAARAIEAGARTRGADVTAPVPVAPVSVPAELSRSAPRSLPSGVEETTVPDDPRPVAPPRSRRLKWLIGIAIGLCVLGPFAMWGVSSLVSKWFATDGTKQEPKNTDPERAAAEWALSVGGSVSVNGDELEIRDAAKLPEAPFRLTAVRLDGLNSLTDAGLAALKDCRHLARLRLVGTPVTDAGLAHFADHTAFTDLDLRAATGVTGAGLVYFKNCKRLTELKLDRTGVTDANLAHLAAFDDLAVLDLSGAPGVTDAGLVHVRARPNMTTLRLGGTGVTDTGLKQLAGMTKLTTLSLAETTVGDAGLAHLKTCPALKELDVRQTQVAWPGIESLRTVLSRCKITWNAGTLHPKDEPGSDDPDRDAARWVIAAGGSVRVNDDVSSIDDVLKLPQGKLQLTAVTLWNKPQIRDADFAVFAKCKNLASIELSDDPIGDAGLAHFPDSQFLKNLMLAHLKNVTDAGLAAFKNCRNLRDLNLIGTPVTGTCLTHFKDCANLTTVALANTRVTDAGLENLKDYKGLTSVGLKDTAVTDKGLAHLARCKGLTYLNVEGTGVTPGGVAAFAKAFPQCRIFWNGGAIHPASEADRTAAVWVLSVGGTVRVDDGNDAIEKVADLPKGPLRLTSLDLSRSERVTDAGLAALDGCKNLTDVRLDSTKAGDEGLAHLRECRSLDSLDLAFTPVSDTGLSHFRDCRHLRALDLRGTRVGDVGAANFRGLTRLTFLQLAGTQVGDTGLAAFKDCTALEYLNLGRTRVSDPGLTPLGRFTKLTYLNLNGTTVTAAGVAKLAKALPRCQIVWDGGAVEVASDADRAAAGFVLDAGGVVHADGQEIKAKGELPKGPFRLTAVFLTKKVKDADLAVFKNCKNLTLVYLAGKGVTTAGLAHFTDCKDLRDLTLAGTNVDDEAVTVIKKFTKLTDLAVGQTQITEKGANEIAKALPGCTIQHDGGTIKPKRK